MATEYAKLLKLEFERSGDNTKILPGPKVPANAKDKLASRINSQVERNAVMRLKSLYHNKT